MCRCVSSLNNQAHRLLTIIREWKWQLEMKAAAPRRRRCRQAAAGGGSAGRRRQMSAVMTRRLWPRFLVVIKIPRKRVIVPVGVHAEAALGPSWTRTHVRGRGASGRERAQPNSLPPSLIQGFVALLNTAAQIICSCSQGGGVVEGGWGQAGLVSHSLGSGEPARSCQTCGPVNVTGLRLRRLPGPR